MIAIIVSSLKKLVRASREWNKATGQFAKALKGDVMYRTHAPDEIYTTRERPRRRRPAETTDWKALAKKLATALRDLAVVPVPFPRDWDGNELDRSEAALAAYREAIAQCQNYT